MMASGGKPLKDVTCEYGVSVYMLIHCKHIGLLAIERCKDYMTLQPEAEERPSTILKDLSLGFNLTEMKLLLDSLPVHRTKNLPSAP